MGFVDMLSGFVNEQVLGLSILIIGLGFVLSKYAKVDKKKLPIIFVLIAVPISIVYHITLASTESIFNRVMDGIYQSMFSICIAMGLYDIGKPLVRAIKNRFRTDNDVEPLPEPESETESACKAESTPEPTPEPQRVEVKEFKCPYHEGR